MQYVELERQNSEIPFRMARIGEWALMALMMENAQAGQLKLVIIEFFSCPNITVGYINSPNIL